jgi:Uma2 family endonuclease
LRSYRELHPNGKHLDFTINEHTLFLGSTRRRTDRAIWTGLGRKPRKRELPSIAIEFVSKRLRDRIRDYEFKRDEYLAAGIEEYLVIDRFKETLTAFTLQRGQIKTRVLRKGQIYKTKRLPGFELDLGRLIDLANAWTAEGDEDE